MRQRYEQALPGSKTEVIATLEIFPISVTVAQYSKPGNTGSDKLRHTPIPGTRNESEKRFLSQELPFNLMQGVKSKPEKCHADPRPRSFLVSCPNLRLVGKETVSQDKEGYIKEGTWA